MKLIDDDSLRLIVMNNCSEFGKMVDEKIRKERGVSNSYIVPIVESRFSNGEGKVVIKETIRNKDVYIISDVGNHSCTYEMFGYTTHIGPDEHFQDIKRVISAIRSHASHITVVTPLLYASRQHKRKGRESLDCAVALQELEKLGVDSIITFDAHDPNVQNAIPCSPFENFYPTNVVLSHIIKKEKINFNNTIVVSPDTGAMDRARYYADMLKCNVGMFYKRRDLSRLIDGKNPIIAHEYLGPEIEGKNIIVVDDMIASGGSILEVAEELKKRGAKKVYLIATFSLFTSGIEIFNKAYKEKIFDKIYTTNLSYILDAAKENKWLEIVDCTSYLADIIHTLNRKESISPLLNGKEIVFDLLKH
jgi:ribose-phosphate pyrophosphokinase